MTVSGEGSKRVYLSVPYEERNEAKAAGARWDRRAKSWYVRGEVSEALRRWQRVQDRGLEAAPESDFAAACATQGLVLKEPPAMDGRWHRVPVADDKPGQLSGSYRGWLDGRPAGVIMNYRSHERAVVWVSAGSTPLDAAALSQAQAESVERKQRLAAELEERQRRVAERAGQLFEQAQPPAEHPYLAAKGVLAHGIRATAENHILVPLREPGSEVIENLQVIREDGSKRFLAGGRKSGLCHLIGDDRDRNAPLLIAEGYATAASLHRATGLPVAVAFDAGNLEAVARAFRQREPERTIGVCADDDHAKRVNAGMDRGRQAAAAIGGQLIAPPLAPADRAAGATDWNDLAASRGLEAVGIEVLSALAAPRPDRRPAPEMRQTSKPARSPVAMGI